MSESRMPTHRPVDEAARTVARGLVRTARFGALATLLAETGAPMATRALLATDDGGRPLMLLSDLSAHTAGLRADGRCSLLLGEPQAGDPLSHPRISLTGRATFLERVTEESARATFRFLARHPGAGAYVELADFNMVRVDLDAALFIAGFAQAYRLSPADLVDEPMTPALVAAGERARAHMNADHADAVEMMARRAGVDGPSFRIATIDSKGFDICTEERLLRVDFLSPVSEPADLRGAFVALAKAGFVPQGA